MNTSFQANKSNTPTNQFIYPAERPWHPERSKHRYANHNMQIKAAELERQLKLKDMVPIYERIGKPDYFPAAACLTEEEIGDAWRRLSELLYLNGIGVSARNPGITIRELYRFTTEELFFVEMPDIYVPGILHCFVYDDFYPDHAHNNIMLALNHCLYQIFRKEPMDSVSAFKKKKLYLNGYEGLRLDEMSVLIDRFKERVSRFELVEFTDIESRINGRRGIVKGLFRLQLRMEHAAYCLAGKWMVKLEPDASKKWKIQAVEIPGIDF